ncbi:MAG: hypothetical protein H6835_09450 [Planctomycetes bacterium]|nr:hypothetical protein [Planctomycetota bacterium]
MNRLWAALLSLPAASCGVSLDYATDDVLAQDAGGRTAHSTPLIEMSGRRGRDGAPQLIQDEDGEQSLAELRAAVQRHLGAACVLDPAAEPIALPADPNEMEALVAGLRDRDVHQLLLPRLVLSEYGGRLHSTVMIWNWHPRPGCTDVELAAVVAFILVPGIVCSSLQINEEVAHARMQLVAIDPVEGHLLGVFDGDGIYQDSCTAWSWRPQRHLPDVMREALAAAIERYGDAARDGFPDRRPLPADWAVNVLESPVVESPDAAGQQAGGQ